MHKSALKYMKAVIIGGLEQVGGLENTTSAMKNLGGLTNHILSKEGR